MIKAATLAGTLAVAALSSSGAVAAMGLVRPQSPTATTVPVVSSDAHKGIGGRYGGFKNGGIPGPKGLDRGPSFNSLAPKGDARKQPYPYRYYEDTSRGNYGCQRYAKRAIDTNNENWWLRYRACTEVGND